ncbi:unnamed protein product [Rotaria socialis]|uniref:Uncharacterized protein n=1 Tax=Rotaria socialis TaxID=392032 RepID=A0A821DGY6_9BILA|nr:unnamed protein product [Rotaria socialis]CAF4621442.1 unnamed protein product [Rotaria socialis]
MIKNSRQHESNPPPKPASIIHVKVGPVKHNSNSDPSLINHQQRSAFPPYPTNRVIVKLNIRKWNNDKWPLPSRRRQQQQQQQKGFITTKTGEVITLILGSNLEIPLSTIKTLPIVFKNADYPNHSTAKTILPRNQNNSAIMGSCITESNFGSGYDGILRNNGTKVKYGNGLFQRSRICIVCTTVFAFLLVGTSLSVIIVSLLINSKASNTSSTISSTASSNTTIAAMTTATASSGTTSCSISTDGVVNSTLIAWNASTSWMSIERNFTASSANSTLIVVISATNMTGWLLDDFSAEDSGGNELLNNGNFENGTVTNGWLSTRCTGANCGAITSSGCNGGSTECFQVTCNTSHALQQTFPTTPGNMYIFSFAVEVLGSTSSSISISYSIT